MENLTPGRKLILDLLAKSVAKIQAAEAENEVKVEDVKTDVRKGRIKRESMEVPVKLSKRIKAEQKMRINIVANKEEGLNITKIDTVKTEHSINMDIKKENKVCLPIKEKELKTGELKINGKKRNDNKNKEKVLGHTTPTKIKNEYTEMKTEEIVLETSVKPEIKDNNLTISNISSSVQNENNKDSIIVDYNIDVKSKEKSDILEQTAKVKDVKTKDAVKQSIGNMTPGRKLILDLLAKSGAKIRAAEAENDVKEKDAETNGRKGKMKRKAMKVPVKLRKKIKVEKKIKETVVATKEEELDIITKIDDIKTKHAINIDKMKKRLKNANKVCLKKVNVCNEEEKLGRKDQELKCEELKKNKENGLVETNLLTDNIKREYSEIRSEEIELESYGNKLACRSNSSTVKNENFKDSIKIKDNSDPTKSKDVQKKEPVKQSLKKEYLRLESDLSLINKLNVCEEVSKENRDKGQKSRFKKITSRKKFSPEEDQIILNAIEKSGGKIEVRQIARDLKRTYAAVRHEVRRLKTGKGMKKTKRKLYTLVEDKMILDAVLQNLGDKSLDVVNLTQDEWKGVGTQIGKEDESSRRRWSVKLRPWILQHLAGTLNLEIARPLANYLAENFTDVNTIDWPSVTNKSEFAGHTIMSLRERFSRLLKLAKDNLHKDCEDITLEMVAELSNAKYASGERKILDRNLKRQQEIIEYFECYVETNCIKDFL